jgi:hypothetical protein
MSKFQNRRVYLLTAVAYMGALLFGEKSTGTSRPRPSLTSNRRV